MLELLELMFKNIGRFVDEQTILFSQVGDFVQVDALNKNTGGSSGSGKTTVFNALDYLLGLNDTPATVLQSRFTKEKLAVTGKFLYQGKPLTITRAAGKIRVEIDGDVTEGNNALAEEKVDTILGMPRTLFRKILHKRQKEGGFFIDMTASEKHDFLTDALNLSEIRKKSQKIDDSIKFLLSTKTKYQNELANYKAGLDATLEAILALGLPPVQDMHNQAIIDLKTKADLADTAAKAVIAKHGIERQALQAERPSVEQTPFDRTLWDQYDAERKTFERQLSDLLQAEKDRVQSVKNEIVKHNTELQSVTYKLAQAGAAKDEAVKIAEQIKKIRACECPTCAQIWNTPEAKAQEQKLMTQLGGLKEIITSATTYKARQAELYATIEGLKPLLQSVAHPDILNINEAISNRSSLILAEKAKYDAHTKSQNSIASTAMQGFYDKEQLLANRHRVELEQAHGSYDVNRRALDIAVSKLKAYEEAKARHDQTANALNKKQEDLTKSILECNLKFETTLKELVLAEEAKKAIKMYISYSFDGALEEISAKATEIIRCIPNMSNATIQFEGTKETKEGKVKEEVNAIIGMDGEIGVPIKSLSGGERSAVDLAVDLAVIDFIESKSAKGMNVFILDEPFTGLGTVEIEMALEVLKNSNTNKKIIIVDHNPEVKQMVQSRIVVEREGTTSKLVS